MYGVRTFKDEPPPTPIRASMLLAGPPLPPSECTYYVDVPILPPTPPPKYFKKLRESEHDIWSVNRI